MNPNGTINNNPYLRTSRLFPEEIGQLVVELNRSYTDISNNVNNRTIGLFPVNRQAIGGESWYVLNNQKQQNIRQVYAFADPTITIPHNINLSSLTNFVRIWGTFFDGTNWQTLPYVDIVAANQIKISVNATNIVITKGAGAPTISNGLIILEWISNV